MVVTFRIVSALSGDIEALGGTCLEARRKEVGLRQEYVPGIRSVRRCRLQPIPAENGGDLPIDAAGSGVERLLIQKALARFEGNAAKAAEALGLSRSAFYRRLEKFGL